MAMGKRPVDEDAGSSGDVESELPFLDRIEVERLDDGQVLLMGVFRRTDIRPTLARFGEDRRTFQTDEAIRMTAEAAIPGILELYRNSYRLKNDGRTVISLSIDYDEEDEDVATSYRGVVANVGASGQVRRFETGDPVRDHAEAVEWAEENGQAIMSSSSLNHFCGDVAGFRWDENDRLVEDPEDSLESRRSGRSAVVMPDGKEDHDAYTGMTIRVLRSQDDDVDLLLSVSHGDFETDYAKSLALAFKWAAEVDLSESLVRMMNSHQGGIHASRLMGLYADAKDASPTSRPSFG